MTNQKLAQLMLRIALVFAFSYAAISSWLDPSSWIGYFPHFLRLSFPPSLLLNGFSLIEIVLAAWLLSNKYIPYAAVISALLLGGIVLFNFNEMDLLFRDVSLLVCALALAVLSTKRGVISR